MTTAGGMIKCYLCGEKVKGTSYPKHYKICSAKKLVAILLPLLSFFMKLIGGLNRKLKRESVVGGTKNKRLYIASITGTPVSRVRLTQYRKKFNDMVKDEEEKISQKIQKESEEAGIKLEDIELIQPLKDYMSYRTPGLSGRQIIEDFLESRGKMNEKVKEVLDRKFKSKDYPTDAEINENVLLMGKINKLRAMSGYRDYYQKYYYFLVDLYEHQNKYKCEYCGGFFARLDLHIKRCWEFKEKFNENKEEVIEGYLQKQFPLDPLGDEKIDFLKDHYKNYSAAYFVETAKKQFKNRIKYIEERENGKRKFIKENSQKKKYNFKDLLDEINKWSPPGRILADKSDSGKSIPEEKEQEEKPQSDWDFQSIASIVYEDTDNEDDEPEPESEDNEEKSEVLEEEINKTAAAFYPWLQKKEPVFKY